MIDIKKYASIINLEYPYPSSHVKMSLEKRATQFLPFSALSGYSDEINEKDRIVYDKIELSDDKIMEINDKLRYLKDHLHDNIVVCITYFEHDSKKSGGVYLKLNDTIKKIDEVNSILYFKNNQNIRIDDILKIEYDIL